MIPYSEPAFFNLEAAWVTRHKRCLVLQPTAKSHKLKTNGGQPFFKAGPQGIQLQNCSLKYLIAELNLVYHRPAPYYIINGTGYKGGVDMHLQGNLFHFDVLNKALKSYGLTIRLDYWPVNVLMVRETKSTLTF